jgi:hypothetical protein
MASNPQPPKGTTNMAWHQKITDNLADFLRFLARGALMLNGILLAFASIYLVAKVIWFGLRYIDKVIFSNPW